MSDKKISKKTALVNLNNSIVSSMIIANNIHKLGNIAFYLCILSMW